MILALCLFYIAILPGPLLFYVNELEKDWQDGRGLSWWRVLGFPLAPVYFMCCGALAVCDWAYENHRRLKATLKPPELSPCRCIGGTNPCPLPPNDRPNQGMLT